MKAGAFAGARADAGAPSGGGDSVGRGPPRGPAPCTGDRSNSLPAAGRHHPPRQPQPAYEHGSFQQGQAFSNHQLEQPLRPMWNRSWLSYRTKPPLFAREINCFERPHLEGLIFWRVLGERLAGRSRRERADSTFGRAGSRQLEPTSRARLGLVAGQRQRAIEARQQSMTQCVGKWRSLRPTEPRQMSCGYSLYATLRGMAVVLKTLARLRPNAWELWEEVAL